MYDMASARVIHLQGRMYAGYAGVADDLAATAAQEIARIGIPLGSIADEIIPPDMGLTAANTEGAYLKSAFWLAKAARLARTAGKPSAAGLIAQAQAFLKQGQPSLLNTLNPFRIFQVYTGTGTSTSPDAISSVFIKAATVTNQGGVSNVTTILQNLAKNSSITQRQDETEGSSIGDYSLVNLYRKYKGYIAAGGVLYLAVLGIGAYVAWRNRSSLAKAAKGVIDVGTTLLV